MNNLEKLFKHHVKDLFNAEAQLERMVDDFLNAAKNDDLKEALRNFATMNTDNKTSLNNIARAMDFKTEGEKCLAMEGIIKEAREFLNENTDEDVQDAGLIAEVQRVAHYFIAGYGTISRWADQMNLSNEIHENCKSCIANAEQIDKKLSTIAEKQVNENAMN